MRTTIIILILGLLFNLTGAKASPTTTAAELGITINKISEQQLKQTYKALEKRQQQFHLVHYNSQKRFELIVEKQGLLELMPLLETIHQAAQQQILPAEFHQLGYTPIYTHSYKFNNEENPHLILPSSLFYPLIRTKSRQLIEALTNNGLSQEDIDIIKAYKESKLTPSFMHYKYAARHMLDNLSYMQSLIGPDEQVNYAQFYTFTTKADYQLRKQTELYWRQWGLELLQQFEPAKQANIIDMLLSTNIGDGAVPSNIYYNTPNHLKSLVASIQDGSLEQGANNTLVQMDKKLSGELAAERKREQQLLQLQQQQLTPAQRQQLAKKRQEIISRINEHLNNNSQQD